MGIHLLVIGHPKEEDSELEEVYARTSKSQTKHFVVSRCSSPAELYGNVRDAVVEHNMFVDLLDLYDHGAGGKIKLGDDPLFEHGGNDALTECTKAIAESLLPLLSPGARVRLLGCNVATGEGGPALLRGLRNVLMERGIVVQGTIARTRHTHFGPGGFLPSLEELYLFSSCDSGNAPTFRQRALLLQAELQRLRTTPPPDPKCADTGSRS